GGARCNALDHHIQSGLGNVDFYAVNTDLQSLRMNLASNKIQIGAQLTGGTGSGGRPETGRRACEESIDVIRDVVAGYEMVFLAAGEGGGTGTGASPLIAQVARQQGCLVVAVVTKPFEFEGQARAQRAIEGLHALRPMVDTLIVIPNEKLHQLYPNEPLVEAFGLADDVISSAVRGVAEIVTIPQYVNIDFSDVRDVLQEPGGAMMGQAVATGADRARSAATKAICSPLMDQLSVETARRALLNICGDERLTVSEVSEVAAAIREATNPQIDIRFGATQDPKLNGLLKVTVIATGIEELVIGVVGLQELLDARHDVLSRRRIGAGDPKATTVVNMTDKNDLRIPTVLRRHLD
ncbi:MAG: cell division protein FtsZ, partial [candidate division WOR-3 bacterium]